jgi:hypothetical protein
MMMASNNNMIAEALTKIATALDNVAEQIANVSTSLDNINDNGSLSEVASEMAGIGKALDQGLGSMNVSIDGSLDTS